MLLDKAVVEAGGGIVLSDGQRLEASQSSGQAALHLSSEEEACSYQRILRSSMV
ncbi:MAG: hypothetical protein QW639_01805 [Candidatus Bathyarchaeia archaeon]